MTSLDTLALVGEVLSWVGLGLGIPLLLVALLIRALEGSWVDVEIAVIERGGEWIARWFAGGDFHERPLTRAESATAELGWSEGVVSEKQPDHARLGEPPHGRRVVRTLGIVFAGVGVLGLIASLLPLFL